jgi:hypothetical protein
MLNVQVFRLLRRYRRLGATVARADDDPEARQPFDPFDRLRAGPAQELRRLALQRPAHGNLHPLEGARPL